MAQQLPLLDTRPHPTDIDRTPSSTRRRHGAGTARKATALRGNAGLRGSAALRGTTALAVVPQHPDVLVEIAAVDWRIDEHTKEVGLAGVAAARQALAAAVGRRAA
jgi:hypothetical protein